MSIIEQIRKARLDYMTNEYDGHGKVSGYCYLVPKLHREFLQELIGHYAIAHMETGKFEGITVRKQDPDYKSFVEFMFINESPERYALATARAYTIHDTAPQEGEG